MVEVSKQDSKPQNLWQYLQDRQQSERARKQEEVTVFQPTGRLIHDTVEISDGSKIVNLNRGNDLATDIKNGDPETLDERLQQGSSDIERIGRLFRAVLSGLRSIFAR